MSRRPAADAVGTRAELPQSASEALELAQALMRQASEAAVWGVSAAVGQLMQALSQATALLKAASDAADAQVRVPEHVAEALTGATARLREASASAASQVRVPEGLVEAMTQATALVKQASTSAASNARRAPEHMMEALAHATALAKEASAAAATQANKGQEKLWETLTNVIVLLKEASAPAAKQANVPDRLAEALTQATALVRQASASAGSHVRKAPEQVLEALSYATASVRVASVAAASQANKGQEKLVEALARATALLRDASASAALRFDKVQDQLVETMTHVMALLKEASTSAAEKVKAPERLAEALDEATEVLKDASASAAFFADKRQEHLSQALRRAKELLQEASASAAVRVNEAPAQFFEAMTHALALLKEASSSASSHINAAPGTALEALTRATVMLRQAAASAPSRADATMKLLEAWDMLNQYVGHPYAMTFVDLWTVFVNVQKVSEVRAQKRAAASFRVTGEIFTTLEALRKVDTVFQKVLGIQTDGQAHWRCEQHYAPNGDTPVVNPALSFAKQGFFPGRTFETSSERECLESVQNYIEAVRWGICFLEELAEKWAADVAKDSTDAAYFQAFRQRVPEVDCQGERALDRALLSRDFRDRSTEQDATCVKIGSRDSKDCFYQCMRIGDCSAVSWKTKRRICCFFSGSVTIQRKRPRIRVGERCLLTARDRFLMFVPIDVGEWLQRHGFGEFSEQAENFAGHGITGMVASFLDPEMLSRWLSSSEHKLEVARAEELRCRIDADLNNKPGRRCPGRRSVEQTLADTSPVSMSKFHKSLLIPKGLRGRWNSLEWIFDVGQRFSPNEEVRAWSETLYELVSVALNAQKAVDVLQGGPRGLSLLALVKATGSISGLMKFGHLIAFNNCIRVKEYLNQVVVELSSKPLTFETQMMHAQARFDPFQGA